MTNYFEFFDIPEKIAEAPDGLRKKYLDNSRKFHPDLYEGEESPEELSSINNEGYKILNDFPSRVRYVLRLKGMLVDGEKEKIDPMFLGEMMEINEGLMELEMDFDEAVLKNITTESEEKLAHIDHAMKAAAERYDKDGDADALVVLKEHYLKRKYLLRIKESIDKFAPA